MVKTAQIRLEYQDLILQAPISPKDLYAKACSNDEQTVNAWRPIWVNNTRLNHEKFKSFKDYGIGRLYGKFQNQPMIIAGSGPSLKLNVDELKKRGNIPLISCLHNYHFFEDRDIHPEFYVSLDAGPIVIDEIYEGGSKSKEEYFASTKDKTLLAFIGSDPRLFDVWQGEILLYNVPIPDEGIRKEFEKLEKFNSFVSTGGNVLGASLYISKAILGSQTSIFIGADFSFSYEEKFHGWDSKYDISLGQCMKVVDIYGIPRKTWPSYYNFKCFFEYVSMNVPGIYINCSEGGALGSYHNGNLVSIRQMDLKDCLDLFNLNNHVREQFINPESDQLKILF